MPEHPICAAHKKLSEVYLHIFKLARQRAADYSGQAHFLRKSIPQPAKSPSILETSRFIESLNKANTLLLESKGLRQRSKLYYDSSVTYFGKWIDCGLAVAKKKTPRPLSYFERLMIVVWYPKVAAAKPAKKAASKMR